MIKITISLNYLILKEKRFFFLFILLHGLQFVTSEVRPEDLLEALDGLPEESVHCAELAVSTLREALANRA